MSNYDSSLEMGKKSQIIQSWCVCMCVVYVDTVRTNERSRKLAEDVGKKKKVGALGGKADKGEHAL